jgi:hypothetical protein
MSGDGSRSGAHLRLVWQHRVVACQCSKICSMGNCAADEDEMLSDVCMMLQCCCDLK